MIAAGTTGTGAVAVVEPSPLAPFLRTRVDEIVADHHSANKLASQAILHAARCGRALVALKDDLDHGQFIPFIEEHLPFTRQTATGYMRISNAVDAGELQMEDAPSISKALKQLATPKADRVPGSDPGPDVRPGTLPAAEIPAGDGDRGDVQAPAYALDTERKRQLAEKAQERFWAVTGHIVGLQTICTDSDASLGQVLHLDRVLAVADHDQLRALQGELGSGIRRARELYDELGEVLEPR